MAVPHAKQPDSLSQHVLTQTRGPHLPLTAHDLSEKFGINNPMRVMHFLESPEGKELKSEIMAKLEMDRLWQDQAAFEALQAKIHKISASLPNDRKKSRTEHDQTPASLDDEDAPEHESTLQDKLEDAYERFTAPELEREVEIINRALEEYQFDDQSLEQAEEELKLEEDMVLKFFDRVSAKKDDKPVNNPEADETLDEQNEVDFQSQLDAYRENLKNELTAIEQALAQSDLAPSDQPSAAPTPKPQSQHSQQSQAQTRQLQTLRANFCKGMINIINKHAEHGQQPTQGNIAQQREHLSMEKDPTGVKHQILNHFQACRSNVAEQRDLTKLKMDSAKTKLHTVDAKLQQKKVTERYDRTVKQHASRTEKQHEPEAPRNQSTPKPR